MSITGNAKQPRAQSVIRPESFYPLIINRAIFDILDAEQADARSKIVEFSGTMDPGLNPSQQYLFWSKFWVMSHEMKLTDFDQGTQEKLKVIREYATERMNTARSAYNPLF
jgi:hypothetical protein